MDNSIGKTVLLTGVKGYIGGVLSRELVQEGYNVIGIARPVSDIKSKNLKTFIPKDKSEEKIIWEYCDIRDECGMKLLFEKHHPNIVIHLAAIVHKKSLQAGYEDFSKTNYEASHVLFELCVAYGVETVIFTSTVEVYGNINNSIYTWGKDKISIGTEHTLYSQGIVLDESSETLPYTDYGKTKLLAERALEKLATPGMRYSILRLSPVYGMGFTLNLDRRIFLIKNRLLYYFGNGSYFFNFCSVNNIVLFVRRFLEQPAKNGIYNISDTEFYTARQLAESRRRERIPIIRLPLFLTYYGVKWVERAAKLFGIKSFISLYNFEKLFRCTIYSNKKALELCGKLPWNYTNTMGKELSYVEKTY